MKSFENGIVTEADEQEYQTWLQEHPDGIVVNLKHGEPPMLHKASCRTIWFPTARREGKLCFVDWTELIGVAEDIRLVPSKLNRCSRCKV